MKRRMAVTSVSYFLAVVMVLGCNAATVQAYINLAAQIALQIAALAGLSPTVANKVSGDLTQAEKLYNDLAKADKAAKPGIYAQIDAVLTQAESDLNDIFALGNVKDVKLQGTIRAALAIAVTALESARTIMLGKSGTNPVAAAAQATLPGGVTKKPMTPDQLRSLYNLTVSDYPQAQIR